MFYYLYYCVTISKSEEKFEKVFCRISVNKNIVALLSSSNFPVKLVWGEILVFA